MSTNGKSPISLPGQEDRKTFYIRNVKRISEDGVSEYFPFEYVCAMALPEALKHGCEDFLIEAQGLRPRRFTVLQIQEYIKKNPYLKRLAVTDPVLLRRFQSH